MGELELSNVLVDYLPLISSYKTAYLEWFYTPSTLIPFRMYDRMIIKTASYNYQSNYKTRIQPRHLDLHSGQGHLRKQFFPSQPKS